ncbi:MAG TPA: lysophospholipid acyltransferase family protein [Tenuifilaceae bacterium]|nr:lysophospholipid acyltransferase family protein [Tenuifilaceae bacterium]HPQ32896.1 lysophospholipid acyltransferase family protein [Tenuifilaceae bacterium]HRX67175.1 lysophospholipid acyltransferase family protein [Tenuifilaceae bacterium]
MLSYLLSFLFFLLVVLVGLLPFPFLYAISNFLGFLLRNVFGYRRKVIDSNLRRVFPELNENQHKKLVRLSYKNLADIFLESIKSFTMTPKQVIRRHRVVNPEVLNQFYLSNRSVIGVTAHYCNWEWGSLSASLQTNFNVVALYKRIDNKFIDRFVRSNRSKFGTTLASISETSKTFESYSSKLSAFLMAADQRTLRSRRHLAYKVNFLGIETLFLHGPEKYARLYNLPVVYIDVQRKKRGFYEVELSVLADNPQELPDGEITRRYAKTLEQIIRKQPENWLWSHRRWRFEN